MNFADYLSYTEELLTKSDHLPPYNNPDYLEYSRLGLSRMKRWGKSMFINEGLLAQIRQIVKPCSWIVITEPWCGDAAPMLPFIARLADENALITLDIQLRDQPPFLIEQYLTNGGKSIPKLIVRDDRGQDLFSWGPRPASAQRLVNTLKAEGTDKLSLGEALQNWYNANKGVEMQQEWLLLFESINGSFIHK